MSFLDQTPDGTLNTHAHTHKRHFCSSSLLVTMRGERITQGRLRDGGEAAARAVFTDVCAVLDLSEAQRSAAAEKIELYCSYKGTTVVDAPLHSQQAITFEWFVNDLGPFEHKTYVNRTVDHPSMHHHPFFFRT